MHCQPSFCTQNEPTDSKGALLSRPLGRYTETLQPNLPAGKKRSIALREPGAPPPEWHHQQLQVSILQCPLPGHFPALPTMPQLLPTQPASPLLQPESSSPGRGRAWPWLTYWEQAQPLLSMGTARDITTSAMLGPSQLPQGWEERGCQTAKIGGWGCRAGRAKYPDVKRGEWSWGSSNQQTLAATWG